MENIRKNSRGRFIAFEGIDGAGKSTQISFLAERVKNIGFPVYETFEPTYSPIGSVIRQMMIGRIEGNHKTIAALFVADRIDHVLNSTNGMLGKVEHGITVLTDRYYFSSYAYHSVHVPMEWVIQANSISSDILKPDLNIFLDLSPEKSFERLNRNRFHLELYENIESMRLVRDNYYRAMERLKDQETVVKVDADRDPEVIAEEIWSIAKPLFEKGIIMEA